MNWDVVDPRSMTEEELRVVYRDFRRMIDDKKITYPKRCQKCGDVAGDVGLRPYHDNLKRLRRVKWLCEKCYALHYYGRIRLEFKPYPLSSNKVAELKKFALRHANWNTVAREFGMSLEEVAWYLSPQRRKERVQARLEMMRAQWILEIRSRYMTLRIAEYLMTGHTYAETQQEFSIDKRRVTRVSRDVFRIPVEFRTFRGDRDRMNYVRQEKKWKKSSYQSLKLQKDLNWDWDMISELKEADRFARLGQILDEQVQLDGIEKLKELFRRPAGVARLEGIGLMDSGDAEDKEKG